MLCERVCNNLVWFIILYPKPGQLFLIMYREMMCAVGFAIGFAIDFKEENPQRCRQIGENSVKSNKNN